VNSAHVVFLTRRGLSQLGVHSLAAFGLISAVVQFTNAVFVPKDSLPYPLATTVAVVVIAVAYGLMRAWPRSHVKVVLTHPRVTISVVTGDLFLQSADLVVGFTDTFDTEVAGDRVINSNSVQGQLLKRVFEDRQEDLDREIDEQLATVTAIGTADRSEKSLGRLVRYPIGTSIVLRGRANRNIFGVAYSHMRDDLTAQSSLEDLFTGLNRLWDRVSERSSLGPVAIPLIGLNLARVHGLTPEHVIRLISLAFVLRAKRSVPTRDLTIVIAPRDADAVNMLEVRSFLRSLNQ